MLVAPVAAALALAVLGAMAPASAAPPGPTPFPGPLLQDELLAKAQPNECYSELTEPATPVAADGTCPEGTQYKVDQHYIWSGARAGDWAYFGTGANTVCNAIGTVFQSPVPYEDDNQACQYQYSSGAEQYGDASGDNRTPQVLRYNSVTGEVQDITPADDENLRQVIGLRGQAVADDTVMLFGQVGTPEGQVIALGGFAWEGSTGRYLGSARLPLAGIREGVNASDGELYLATRVSNNPFGGSVVRWTGTKENPFFAPDGSLQFETVGVLPNNEAGYMIEHDGHLVVSGWAFANPSPPFPGHITNGPTYIWMSPKLSQGGPGLEPDDADDWKTIFSWADYDPDPVLGESVVWGDLVSWRGDLFIGSYQLDSPGTGVRALWTEYGQPADTAGRVQDIRNSFRPVTMFQIKNAGRGNGQKVTLLYGSPTLPVRDAAGTWSQQPNLLGQTPKLGPAGYGNPWNVYSWTWIVFNDRLYMGTFDMSSALGALGPVAERLMGLPDGTAELIDQVVGPAVEARYGGFDLWRMDSPNLPAVPETLSGYDSRSQFGIRIMVSFEDKGYFVIGTAGTENLNWGSSPDDPGQDPGGWELRKLTPGAPQAPVAVPPPPTDLEQQFGDILYAGGAAAAA